MTQDAATSIARNTTVMIISQGATWISSFILMLVLPRHLGSEDYGRLYLAVSLTMMFQIVIDFGGSYYIAKEVARYPEKAPELITHSIVLRSVLWLGSMGAMLLIATFAQYSTTVTLLILILGTAKLWEGAAHVLVSCFQGFEMMRYPSIGAIVERVVVTGTGLFALLHGANSVVIAILMGAGSLLSFGLLSRFMRKSVSSLPHVDWGVVLDLLKVGTPYFLYSIFAVVYYRMDAVLLSIMAPEYVVGCYGAAYRFFDVLMFLPSIFSLAAFPVLSRLTKANSEDLSRVTCRSLEVMIVAGIPMSIAVFAFAKDIISLFFGLQEYGPAVLLLRIFSLGLLLVYVDFILGATLFASDRQRRWTAVAFGAMLLNALLNYFAIPYTQKHLHNGGIGSAIATLLTEFFVMAMALQIMPKGLLTPARLPVQFKSIAAGVLMVACILLMGSAQMHWIAVLITGLIAYGLALIILKAFSAREIVFVRRCLSFQNMKNTIAPGEEMLP